MKIGEAQQKYREQVHSYRQQKSALTKQLEDVRKKLQHFPADKETQEKYQSEAATLELTLDALDEKESEYQEYLDQLAERYCAYWNATVAEQQKELARWQETRKRKSMIRSGRMIKSRRNMMIRRKWPKMRAQGLQGRKSWTCPKSRLAVLNKIDEHGKGTLEKKRAFML